MAKTAAAQKVRLESIADRVEVAPGVHMPRLGLGTWQAHAGRLKQAIGAALEMGYRSFDTSANYYNEEEVGEAVANSGLPREDLFITTKLEGPDQGRDRPRYALRDSLRRLRMDYVDLYLIHWPDPLRTLATWEALEELRDQGLARAIGVSNFGRRDLHEIISSGMSRPAVNQVELHPLRQRLELQEYCGEYGITLEAWSPVMRGHASSIPELVEIGRHHGKTAEQISLRWILQKGIIAIPKSVHEQRLRQNADLYDFELDEREMAAVDMLDAGRRLVL